ncbi:uncharacterized protein B0H18DRAFT_1208460 [Fomitopsis serialis]|uniref:uncharacterized protein n=1 Tax=Fomitopsis serialis TaxID=139415 RepID=UPI0020084AB1|nr:uncharacterized protein B0H18DRAFT_1208460 [Neoantrodia serialis]KAH9932576.1 hypothetical protein B0H18DRAFT_1208460 [Neoantrodia serialis]
MQLQKLHLTKIICGDTRALLKTYERVLDVLSQIGSSSLTSVNLTFLAHLGPEDNSPRGADLVCAYEGLRECLTCILSRDVFKRIPVNTIEIRVRAYGTSQADRAVDNVIEEVMAPPFKPWAACGVIRLVVPKRIILAKPKSVRRVSPIEARAI